MASIRPLGKKWRVQVYVNGARDSGTFDTRQEASRWALEREAELGGKKLPAKSYGDALSRYAREVAPSHKGSRWELVRLKSLQKEPMAKRRLSGLSASDFADWRDARLAEVKPGTVARELNLIHSVLESARRDWGYLTVNPLSDVRWPTTPAGRKRGVTADEVDAVAAAFGVKTKLLADTATQRVGLMFLFALETAMRSGEMCGLRWRDIHLTARYACLPETKNGDKREVPLSTRAVDILKALPEGEGPVFGVDDVLRDALWRKTRPKALKSLRFHDTRGEAIRRLSKKFDVLQLARVIGHRDLKSLMHYYDATASELATLLD